ncbi:response regulator transcription factor [Paenibacillus sp. UNC451MF]|uniref:response regulator transcription factor n=1 Tax=Paenibacillus sp. UNC451MF TaxID=1449063 RepID=UPI00048C5C97|nr:response regulator [Paenibacillus sp. UNC451MF]
MYRLIIVDDEEDIREGLCDIVDWMSLGFHVVDKLSDGREAIHYLQENKVDVILTDIKMTFVSGIDLAKYIHDKKLKIKIVFLSGFKEFTLAREAINYNVSNYLLKPTDLDELTDIFRKIHKELEEEKAEHEQVIRQHQHVKTLRPLLMEQFFYNLLFGSSLDKEKEELGVKLKQLGLPVDLEKGMCCILRGAWSTESSPNHPAERNLEDRQVLSLAITKERDQIQFTCVKADKTHFLIIGNALEDLSSEVFEKRVETYFMHIQTSLSALVGLSICLEKLDLFSSLEALFASFHKASSVLEEKNETAKEVEVHERLIIKHAKQFISGHYEKNVTLAEVSHHVGLNPVYFSRLFKQETGMTFSDFVIDVRIKKAMEYLRNPKYKVYEIGYLVGYKDIKHFHQLFKRQTGLTPTEFRDKL